jgi:hypothetical protein
MVMMSAGATLHVLFLLAANGLGWTRLEALCGCSRSAYSHCAADTGLRAKVMVRPETWLGVEKPGRGRDADQFVRPHSPASSQGRLTH